MISQSSTSTTSPQRLLSPLPCITIKLSNILGKNSLGITTQQKTVDTCLCTLRTHPMDSPRPTFGPHPGIRAGWLCLHSKTSWPQRAASHRFYPACRTRFIAQCLRVMPTRSRIFAPSTHEKVLVLYSYTEGYQKNRSRTLQIVTESED